MTRGSFSEVGGDEDWTTCLDVAAGDGVEDGVVVGVGTTVVGAVGPWTTMGGGSQLRRSASDPSSILAGVAADWIVVASLWSLHLFNISKFLGNCTTSLFSQSVMLQTQKEGEEKTDSKYLWL